MPDMEIFVKRRQTMEAPVEEIRKAFEELMDQPDPGQEFTKRVPCGFLESADFVGDARGVATSDDHILLSAALFRLRSAGPEDPYRLVRAEEPCCELIARLHQG